MSEAITCRVCGARTDAYACKDCTAILERAIGDLPGLVRDLVTRATRADRVYRSTTPRRGPDEELAGLEEEYAWRTASVPAVTRSRDGRITLPAAGAPADLGALDLIGSARNTTGTWARHLAESRGVELVAPNVRIGWTACVSGWLLRNIDAVRLDEAAGVIFADLTALRDQMARAVDRSQSRVYAGPCQTEGCTQPAESGEGRVQSDVYAPWKPASMADEESDDRDDREFLCDGYRASGVGCGQGYTWRSRRPWLVEAVRGALVSIDDLLAALPDLFPELPVPPRGSINGWIKDGRRLESRGQDPLTGEALFVGAEVLALIEGYRPKTYAPRPNRRVVMGNCA